MRLLTILFVLINVNSYTKEKIEKLYHYKNNKFSVLIFTKTNGFVHVEAINEGIKLISNIGQQNNFNVAHTNISSFFTEENLKNYQSIIFLNTTLDVLNKGEEIVFKNFIQNGGGFVGIHSAADTEYKWEWYGKLVGAYFKNHPEIQKAKISTITKNHISTSHLNATWEIEEEWYNYKNINPEITVLLNLDESTYDGGENGKNHPITWYHEFDGGKSFYTGLGHKSETYHDKRFIKLITGGILYTLGTKN